MIPFYDSNEMIDVAQHCKNFRARGSTESKKGSSEMSVSCLTCNNWNTDGCISDSYDGALRCMEKNQ
ncbi:MAG TPA: hypothetical protein GXX20_03895 [Clostridiaceae bacterium]|nr:hypothetical protein [Clostridiaceae bacterium]